MYFYSIRVDGFWEWVVDKLLKACTPQSLWIEVEEIATNYSCITDISMDWSAIKQVAKDKFVEVKSHYFYNSIGCAYG